MLARFVSALVVASVGMLGPAHAADLLVPSQYATIQAAIDAAVTGDRVLIAAGTYPEAIDFLGKDIEVVGAGMDDTVIDATGLDTSVVKIMSGEGPAAVLEGVTLTGGSGTPLPSIPSWLSGGGLFVHNSNPTVRFVRFESNRVEGTTGERYGGGAAFWIDEGLALPATPLEDCEFIGNHADLRGGGLHTVWEGAFPIRRSRFEGNTTHTGSADYLGGGAYFTAWNGSVASQPLVEDCVFVGNQSNFGGATYAWEAVNSTFRRCVFYNNTGTGWFGGGAASYVEGPALFESCVFLSNFGSHYSTLRLHSAQAVVRDSVFWGNDAGLSTNPDYDATGGGGSSISLDYSYANGAFTDSPEILDDPGFVADAGNWQLRPWSQLIDAGDPSAPLDPDGSRRDIGIGGVLLPVSPIPIVGDRYTYLTPRLGSYGEALDYADAVGGRLLELHTSGEEAQLGVFPTYTAWSGLREIGGVWQWDSGAPLSWDNWLPGEPNGSGPQAIRRSDGLWQDRPASDDYPAIIERDAPFTLLPNTPRLSVSAEDELALTLNVGAEHAGESYFVLGSVSGTEPGLPLGPFHLPLNFDAFTNWTLNKPSNPFLANSLGVIDGKGWAVCRFRLVSGIPSGFPVSFAAVTFLPGAQKTSVTNAVSVQLDP